MRKERANSNSFFSWKTCVKTLALVLCGSANADTNIGIIGGYDNNSVDSYAAFVSSSGAITPIAGLPSTATSLIYSVALNNSGLGLIGGQATAADAYAAFISSSGTLTPIVGLPTNTANIRSVSLNSSNVGLIGGTENAEADAYAAFVYPSGTLTQIMGLPTNVSEILSVKINSSGEGLIGGFQSGETEAYAAFVSSSGTLSPIAGLPTNNAFIISVALNDSGQGLIGGYQNTAVDAYAAVVSSSGTFIAVSGLPTNDSQIYSVAVNASGQGLIGGYENNLGTAYAAFVSSSGVLSPISGLPSNGAFIQSVAINDLGQGLIGGRESGVTDAYAALVSPSGTLTPIVGLPTNTAEIISVAINSSGQGLIGGFENNQTDAYAALVSSSGILTPILGLPTNSSKIFSVALLNLSSMLSAIPTGSLSGNNLIFANYINTFAPQDAFYFIPSSLNGTLNAALESAAPTRNAFSLYTANNNLFYITNFLQLHLRQSRSIQRFPNSDAVAKGDSEDYFLASIDNDLQSAPRKVCEQKQPAYSIWFEAIGALAFQDAQHQTPGFNPSTAGGILSFDAKVSENAIIGGGATYLYTHIHEKGGAGEGHINQEDILLYASWDNSRWYFDLALLGGWFQTNQVRNIRMTSFAFESYSKPNGWQLDPHLEVGFNISSRKDKTFQFRANPLVMVDWANCWQKSFTETGSGPFNVTQNSQYGWLLRTEAALRFYETFLFDNWNLVLQELGGYVNTQNFGSGKVTAFLVGSGGLFTVETLQSAQNLGIVQFSANFIPLRSCYPATTLGYQGEFGSKYQSHEVVLDLDWMF